MTSADSLLLLHPSAGVLSQRGVALVRRQRWSMSSAKAHHGCRVRYAFDKIAPRPPAPLDATHLGGLTHEILEAFYHEAPQARDLTLLRHLTKARLARESEVGQISEHNKEEYDRIVWGNVSNIFERENPHAVTVEGCEREVKGEVGGVPIIGYIDRLDREGDGLAIVDYKTGKIPQLRFGDTHGDQLRLYSLFYPEATHGTLYYLTASATRHVEFIPEEVEATVRDIRSTWQTHQRDMEAGRVPYVPGPLCGWCPLVRLCPQAARDSDPRYHGALSEQEINALLLDNAGENAPGAHSHSDTHATPREEHPMSTVRFVEAKPWEETRGVNIASPDVVGAFYYLSLARDHLRKQDVHDREEIHALAHTFAWIVSGVAGLYSDGEHLPALHTRLRGALTSILDTYPYDPTNKSLPWAKKVIGELKATVEEAYAISTQAPVFATRDRLRQGA